LSAHIVNDTSTPAPAAPAAPHDKTDSDAVLNMLPLRYGGQHTARDIKPPAGVDVEMVVDVDEHGTPHVHSPATGVAAMAGAT
jgi:hypothetical protein